MFAKLEDAVKLPEPKVKVPLLIMVPFAIIFPAPPVKIPPELMVVFGRLIEYVLFANVIGDGIIKSLLTIYKLILIKLIYITVLCLLSI